MAAYARLFAVLAFGLLLALAIAQGKRLAGSSAPQPLQQTSAALNTEQIPEIQIGVPAKISVEPAVPSRNVGGSLIAPPIESEAPLERIEAIAQPTPPPLPKPVEPKKPFNYERWRLVYNAVATSAGVFQTNETALVLPGIDVVSADEKCRLADGTFWPCGMVARTSFRSFINGRALTCKLPDVPEEKSIEADCRLRGRDLAEWLVANGWARAKKDGPYLEQQASAEQSRRGIYGNPPKGVAVSSP